MKKIEKFNLDEYIGIDEILEKINEIIDEVNKLKESDK